MIKNRFVLIDAFALIFRAYYALPALTNKEGVQLNAAYGFTSALLAAIKTLEPEYLVCGFDLPKPTKRHLEYVEYKAHRAPMPEDLMAQVPYVREILQTMNIPVLAVEGYEGEDVIATIVAKVKGDSCQSSDKNTKTCNLKPETFEFVIVTGDLDCLQLVDGQTKVYSMARGVNQALMYDEAKVRERYGLAPAQFVDFKALKGDPSDNIPGVKGIGEKTAISLIQKFGSLEELYRAINPKSEILNPKQIQNSKFKIQNEGKIKKIAEKTKISEKVLRLLLENKEQAFLSKKLSKIVDDVPLEFNLENAKIHDYDQQKVIALFTKLGFKSLIARLPDSQRLDNQQKLL